MMDQATTQIDPSNIKTQLLTTFNQIFPQSLNESLNHEIFGENIDYSFNSETHGNLNMKIVHQLQTFGIDPTDGYKVIFKTIIDGHPNITCAKWVPESPFSFQYLLFNLELMVELKTFTLCVYIKKFSSIWPPTTGLTPSLTIVGRPSSSSSMLETSLI